VGHFLSLRPLSLTQPNHARCGTVIGILQNQYVRGWQKGCGFERAALRRGEPGSNALILCTAASSKRRAPPGEGLLRRLEPGVSVVV
jgi:hypothetical protein